MFLDSSAIVAILAREIEGAALTTRLEHAGQLYTSPIAIYEAVSGLVRAGDIAPADAEILIEQFLAEVGVEIVPITAQIAHGALQAFDRYGKGRHPAGLNMGDCFAYACAQNLRAPLLFKGEDFPLTDIAAVLDSES